MSRDTRNESPKSSFLCSFGDELLAGERLRCAFSLRDDGRPSGRLAMFGGNSHH